MARPKITPVSMISVTLIIVILETPLSILQRIVLRANGKEEVLEVGSGQSSAISEEGGGGGGGGGGRVGKRASATKTATGLFLSTGVREQGMATPTTPHLPQPGQLSLVVANVIHGGGGSTLVLPGQPTQQRAAKRGGARPTQVSTTSHCLSPFLTTFHSLSPLLTTFTHLRIPTM